LAHRSWKEKGDKSPPIMGREGKSIFLYYIWEKISTTIPIPGERKKGVREGKRRKAI